jgi:hypothetical protein
MTRRGRTSPLLMGILLPTRLALSAILTVELAGGSLAPAWQRCMRVLRSDEQKALHRKTLQNAGALGTVFLPRGPIVL